jgi:two-component system cell cycle sensor histidine kinase/response regulator CckA
MSSRQADPVAHAATPREPAPPPELHALLRAIVDNTPDAICVKDLQGHFLLVNRAFADLRDSTVDDIVGRRDTANGRDGLSADDVAVLASGEPRASETTIHVRGAARTLHAVTFPFHAASGTPAGLVEVLRDTTERRHVERQVQEAQKMEAIGRLAGAVAHNFNNLLTVILGYADVLGGGGATAAQQREAVDEIVRGAERAAWMTRQLLAFSRAPGATPRLVDVGAALTDLQALLRPLLARTIELSVHAAADAGSVVMDRGHFDQAITTLVTNAGEAMPAGGRLRLEALRTRIDAGDDGDAAAAGDYVEVRVWDSGRGMDDATRARLFEPFFTTKPEGMGIGLGLSMVYGFVTQLGGHIEVTSAPGSGTLFRLLLPRSPEAAPAPQPTAGAVPLARGTETVLLVEDEDAVRQVARLVLQSRGYRVLEARDGVDALAVAHATSERIDLLLSDLVMPRMNGQQLAERMAEARPGLRVLLMSGYPDRVAPGVDADPRFEFLSKPFQPAVLARRVRECLDRGGPGRSAD